MSVVTLARRGLMAGGAIAQLGVHAVSSAFRRPLALAEVGRQIEVIGYRSMSVVVLTAIFSSMVMTVQFAVQLARFGAKEYVGNVVSLSLVRELGPVMTALMVGGRVGAGIAAELGSMSVTEQIDAIRALGADPIRKLVVPRLLACVVIMPLITCFALVFGTGAAMIVADTSFGVPSSFFLTSALESVDMQDLMSGLGKTPFFGFIIAIIGCHFGMQTTGGTEGVGRSTTTSVVATCVAILIADAILTQAFLSMFR